MRLTENENVKIVFFSRIGLSSSKVDRFIRYAMTKMINGQLYTYRRIYFISGNASFFSIL